jgi:WD40 repeat protein
VAFSPDSKLLASASCNSTVRLWDTGLQAALHTLKGHSNNVYTVAFLPDSKLLVSASDDKTVRLWDAGSEAALYKLEVDYHVQSLLFSQDGTLLQTNKRSFYIATFSNSTMISLNPFSVLVEDK